MFAPPALIVLCTPRAQGCQEWNPRVLNVPTVRIFSKWLACHTQEAIAQDVKMQVSHVSEFLRKNSEKYQQGDSELFRNFEPKVYTVWNFDKATNEVRHFGNIPPEVLDNLLYYYTQPFDVVFDPFAGGGMALDVCAARTPRPTLRHRELRPQAPTLRLARPSACSAIVAPMRPYAADS